MRRNMVPKILVHMFALAIVVVPLLTMPLPANSADLGSICNCYCCPGKECDPAHVGTVQVGRPGDVNATCDKCTAQACSDAYPLYCPAVIPGAEMHGVTEPSCDSGRDMNESPCDITDDFAWSCEIEIQDTISNGEIAVNSYNLKSLCKDEGYNWVDKANNAWFNINICGYSPKQCFPADCAADGVLDDGDTKRTWNGAPCTPWDATANVGSVVRFFQSNLDPPPKTNTKGHNGKEQMSCDASDGQIVQCTEACTVPVTSMMNEMGTEVAWFANPGSVEGYSGLTLSSISPPTVINADDPSNPLGKSANKGQACEGTQDFPGGLESAQYSFVCKEGMSGANILRVDTSECQYTIIIETGAVCPGAIECGEGTGVCTSGPNAGWCSKECAPMGWFPITCIIISCSMIAYCVLGSLIQRRATGECKAPHTQFWASCLTCHLCCGDSGAGSSFQQLFGPKQESQSTRIATATGLGAMDHPDNRVNKYGSV